MKKLPFIAFKINLFLALYCISSLTVGPFSCIHSLEIDRIIVPLEEA